ncbi:hypothetical protein CAPTEDRAFT_190501 [Capitella teleta]|uniref:Uncharacterized protein n=1 Tax=Capitella teleta TaxID=283909 RepID=R7TH02_CAPTE|nr:hypothetical protein CAPTEDRAFT_190501 [Capitella teleta]|eukprot:ELT92984.1 hypothetical protein CAPTEDRAFT_190501 [Capitella teleta]
MWRKNYLNWLHVHFDGMVKNGQEFEVEGTNSNRRETRKNSWFSGDLQHPKPAKKSMWNKEHIQEGTNTVMAVTEQYRPSFHEMETARRGKHQKKKEKKKKERDEEHSRAMWNIDNELASHADLHFRVHRGLVMLYGSGLSEDHRVGDVKMGCLSFLK